MIINCLIIDDEPASREVLETYISDTKDLNLVKSCKNALEANEILKKENIQLLFLDINMPKLSGMQFYKALIHPPMVIFTTAYPQYAIEGFEVEAIDYLLKPFPFDRFLKAVNKAFNKWDSSIDKSSDYIVLKADKKVYRIGINDIIRLESVGDYVKVFYSDQHILVHESMQNLLLQLPTNVFVRVHKSHSINFLKLQSIDGNRIFIEAHEVPMGATYKNDVMSKMSL